MTTDLTVGIVRILDSNNQTAGAGFVLTAEGLIATCAHVVESAGARPGDTVSLVFHLTGDEATATVEPEGWRAPEVEDIAVLRLNRPLPSGVMPLPLGRSNGTANHLFETFGFPDINPVGGLVGGGQILGQTTLNNVHVLQLRSQEVTGGFSGAPVLDIERQQVISMITATVGPDRRSRLGETVIGTPTETLLTVWSGLSYQPDPLTKAQQAYRYYILRETEYIEMKGIPLPEELEQIPLDRVYIRLQAVARQTIETQRQAEREALVSKVQGTTSATTRPVGLLRHWLDSKTTTKADPAQISAAVLRLLGEQYYRQGSLYRSDERPEPISPEEALCRHNKLVILGAPGAGKSTLLRYLARQIAYQADGPLPILVSLRDYTTALTQNATLTLRDFALSQIKDHKLIEVIKVAEAQQQILWLVDALDEARGNYGAKAVGQIKYLSGQWVVTSRPVGYPGGMEEKDIYHFEVLPLAPTDVNRFLQDWLGLVAQRRHLKSGWVEQRLKWIDMQLQQQSRLQPLTRNPLLLTFLVTLASEPKLQSLPTTRGELYDRYLSRLWAGWERQRRHYIDPESGKRRLIIGHLEGEEAYASARQGLHYLGWRLHLLYYGGHGDGKPDQTHLVAYLAACLQHHRAWLIADTPESLAADIVEFWREAGLLDEWRLEGQSFFAFRHLTFQEYATAQILAQTWSSDPSQTWSFICPRLYLPAWRETWILLGHSLPSEQSEKFLKRVLQAHSPYKGVLRRELRLAAAIVAGGALVSNQQAQHILKKLIRLGRRATRMHRLTLIIIYTAGLSTLSWPVISKTGPFLGFYLQSLIVVLWTLAWIIIWLHVPVLWRLLAWPTRLWPQVNFDRDLVGEAGRLRDVRVVEPLQDLLSDPHNDVRTAATVALGQLGEVSIEPLRVALRDGDKSVRRAAAEALGQLGDARAVAPLLTALQDDDKNIRRAAAAALKRLGIAVVKKQLADHRNRQEVALALGWLGNVNALELLLRELRNPWHSNDWRVVEALGQLGDARAVKPLLETLQNQNRYVRWAAAEALGQLGDARATEQLVKVTLQDSEEYVRQAAAVALSQLRDTHTVEPLLVALNNEKWLVRRAAAKALGQLGDTRAIEPLLMALQDKETYVREVAAEALGQLADNRATESLVVALQDHEGSVRKAATIALGRLGESQVVKPLRAVLKDSQQLVRVSAAEALGQLEEILY